MAEIGLRYRPTSQTDLEAHAAQLALLSVDLADMPPDLLRRAVSQWATRSPYLPKASDLIGLAKDMLPKPVVAIRRGQSLADQYNDPTHPARSRPDAPAYRHDICWVDDGHGGVKLVHGER